MEQEELITMLDALKMMINDSEIKPDDRENAEALYRKIIDDVMERGVGA